jgi:hypothetical protein
MLFCFHSLEPEMPAQPSACSAATTGTPAANASATGHPNDSSSEEVEENV